MKKRILLVLYLLATVKSISQKSVTTPIIDSLVDLNETKVSTVFQKIEKSKIVSTHKKNSDNNLYVYRFTDSNVLISSTFIAYSVGDTELIINFYFDSGSLRKVTTADFKMNGQKHEYKYYYSNNQLINKDAETAGIHRGSFYLEYAARIRRNLKKRPIKFPF